MPQGRQSRTGKKGKRVSLPRGKIALLLGGLLVLRWGWLWVQVRELSTTQAWEVSSVLYGRPFAVRPGDLLAPGALAERLGRLGYRKAEGTPDGEGTWSLERERLKVFTRGFDDGARKEPPRRLEVRFDGGRVREVRSFSGRRRGELLLEPEEFARFLGPSRERRSPVPLGEVPRALRNAVLAAEDDRFYSHIGIDFAGTLRALTVNIRERRFAQGGSTITQQLAKNHFLSPEKSLWRKVREAELALLIELRYSKDDILEAYLNEIYLGQGGYQGIFGVEEASRFYFAKGTAELSLPEAALLAGIIRAPNRYAPHRRSGEARERRDWVLARMAALGMIDTAAMRAAAAEPVRTWVSPPGEPRARYFMDQVARVVEGNLPGGSLSRGGYRIHTSLDTFLQAEAERAVGEGLELLSRRAGPEGGGEPLQAALVAVDPATGEVTAMVGGSSYGETQFNRAVDARRQPGSAFKPFVLLAAMERTVAGNGDLTLSSKVSGGPIALPGPPEWRPSNFEGRRYGEVTLRRTVEESVNTAAVRLALDLGLGEVAASARRAGITSALSPLPSLALGSFEVTPLELAGAYATLAAEGTRRSQVLVRTVTSGEGKVLLTAEGEAAQAVDPRAAYLVTAALEGVLERGTGRRAREMGLEAPAAGKTGTSDGYRDSWFAGYTPRLVCVVWTGRDSGGGTGLTGSSGALEIWTRFMRAVVSPGEGDPFTVPEGITLATVDRETGYRATSNCPERIEEAFVEGTVPSESCPVHPGNPLVEGVRKGFRELEGIIRKIFN